MFSDEETARLTAWIAADVDPAITSLEVVRMAGGHSSGAWRVDATGNGRRRALVLKAPDEPSVVFRRDARREARILDAVGRLGAPVPAVVATDDGARTIGRPCFLMEYVEGRSVADAPPGGCHDDPWLRAAGPDAQRATWESFHDALAALHSVDVARVPDTSLGPNGLADVVEYWRASLLDAAPSEVVPRQLALLDWLGRYLPTGADDTPAVCLGDARLVNGLFDGTEVRALVDFEVAYTGHPAADIGYSLFFDGLQRRNIEHPLPGIPSPDETWRRWARVTGRADDRRAYWTAFGAMVLGVTATRAMLQWGLAAATVEADNPVVAAWEQAVQQARTT